MQNAVEVFTHFAQQNDVHIVIQKLKTDPTDGDSPRLAGRENDRSEDQSRRRPVWPSPRV